MAAKILIIEPEKRWRDAYARVLRKHGHNVQSASSAKTGQKKLSEFKPLIVLLALLLPDMDGLELLHDFRQTKQAKRTSVIILSKVRDEAKIEQARKLGAYKYIIKADTPPAQLAHTVSLLYAHNLEKKRRLRIS